MGRFTTQQDVRERPRQASTSPVLTDPESIGGDSGQVSASAVKLFDAASTILVRNRLEDKRREKVNQSNHIRASMINGMSDIQNNQNLSLDEKDVAVQALTSQVLSGNIHPDVISDTAPFIANQLRDHADTSFLQRRGVARQDANLFISFISKDSDMDTVDRMLDEMLPEQDEGAFKLKARSIFESKVRIDITNKLSSKVVNRQDKSSLISEIKSKFSTVTDSDKAVSDAIDSAARATALRGEVGETEFLTSKADSMLTSRKQELANLAKRNFNVVSNTQRGLNLIASGNPDLEAFPDDDETLNGIAGLLQGRGQTNAEVIDSMLGANAKRVAPTSIKRIELDFNEGRISDGILSLQPIKAHLGSKEATRIARSLGNVPLTSWQVTDHPSFRQLSSVDQASVLNLLESPSAPAMMSRADFFLFGDKEDDPIVETDDFGAFIIDSFDGANPTSSANNQALNKFMELSFTQREQIQSLYRFELLTFGSLNNIAAGDIDKKDSDTILSNASEFFLSRNTPIVIQSGFFSGTVKFIPAFVGAGTGAVSTDGALAIQDTINGRLRNFLVEDTGGIFSSLSSVESMARVVTDAPIEINGKFYMAAINESGVRAFVRYDPLDNETDLVTPERNTQEFGQASIKFNTGSDPKIFSDLFPFMRGSLRNKDMLGGLGQDAVDKFIGLAQDKFNIATQGRDYNHRAPDSPEQTRDTQLWNEILNPMIRDTEFKSLYPKLVSPGPVDDTTDR